LGAILFFNSQKQMNKQINTAVAIAAIIIIAGVFGWLIWKNEKDINSKTSNVSINKPVESKNNVVSSNSVKNISKDDIKPTDDKLLMSAKNEDDFKATLFDIYANKVTYEKYKNSPKPYTFDNLNDGLIIWSLPYKKGSTYAVQNPYEDGYGQLGMENIISGFLKATSAPQILKLPSIFLGHGQANYEARKITLGKRNFLTYEDFGVEGGYFTRVYLTLDEKTQQILVIGMQLFSVEASEISSQEKCELANLNINTKALSEKGCYMSNIKYPEKASGIINQVEKILSEY
jgi:hypothetical protein